MIIRPCEPADIRYVQAIYAHHVLSGFGTFEEAPPTVEEVQRRYGILKEKNFPFLVAEVDGQVAGYAYAGPYNTRSGYRYTCEDTVYVAPKMNRRGIGRALLLEVIAECQRLNLRQMLAVIGDSGNQGSIGLHTQLGFEQVGVFKNVGYKFDRWVDVVVMQRAL